jgi:hypothetical protein
MLSACSLFEPRAPEPPGAGGGTYVQPSAPEQVLENVQAAVRELEPTTYRRSFDEDFAFTPTAEALARDPGLWVGWSLPEEDGVFRQLVAAAEFTSGNELRLNDVTLTLLAEDSALYDATYVLTLNHRRAGTPETVQGRLAWTLAQGDDGLWRILSWEDQRLGSEPSWSDLKAAFAG